MEAMTFEGVYTALTNDKVKDCVGSKWDNCVVLQKRQTIVIPVLNDG